MSPPDYDPDSDSDSDSDADGDRELNSLTRAMAAVFRLTNDDAILQ